MSDQAYQEYKEHLLHDRHFMDSLINAFRDCRYSTLNYFADNKYYLLIGPLSFASGVMFIISATLGSEDNIRGLVVKCLLIILFLALLCAAVFCSRQFKLKLTRNIYFSYVEPELIANRVHQDQIRRSESIKYDLSRYNFDLSWHLDMIKGTGDMSETVYYLERTANALSNLEENVAVVLNQFYYPKQLSKDYYFTKELYEYVSKE